MTLEEIKALMDECEDKIRLFNLEYLERMKAETPFVPPKWKDEETPQQNQARYSQWQKNWYRDCSPEWALDQRAYWNLRLNEVKAIHKSEDERTWS